VLWAHAALSVLFCISYVVGAFTDAESARLVVNSSAKDALFVVLSVLAASHIRRYGWLTLLIALAYVVLVAAEALMLIRGDNASFSWLGAEVGATSFLIAWLAVDVALIVLLVWMYHRAQVARYELGYLTPYGYVTLGALAEVLIKGEAERVPAAEVARNVDRYLSRIPGRGRGRIQLALVALTALPLLFARPPFPAIGPGARLEFLKKRFVRDLAARRGGLLRLEAVRGAVQAMIRVASQMTYLGYYGDERSHASVGYAPFSRRPGSAAKLATVDHDRPGVRCLGPAALRNGGLDADVVVVGSGAAGSILAYRLAEAGRRVLVLERGPHVDPRDFVEDEVAMYLKLYNEGALQVARDFRFQVLQGMCVGGSTVVNNAICFDPPPAVLDRWGDAGLDRASVEQATREVREWLRVRPVQPDVYNPAGLLFADGMRALGLGGRVTPLEVNIQDCLGSGYCNIGCAYGRKLSMLDVVLPEGQARFGDRLQVLPDLLATGIEHDGHGRAVAIHGELGGPGGESVRIGAETVVVAAGAVGSSWLLLRSGVGGPQAGHELYFNATSPLTADFDRVLDAHCSMQMTHAYEPEAGAGFLIETWFNPVATQALAMPGWFEDHYANMLRYRHMVCAGVLVGTTVPARVKASREGPEIDYTPVAADLSRVVDGLKLVGRLFLGAGARRVMPATYAWHEFTSEGALDALDDYVRDGSDLLLTSAHPQGGNAIGAVVDERFRVHGFSNLHVCDASVFPSSVTVNPQLTVMALAQYAAPRVLEG
jgi:choline dehydrogenase-like flavoprotein